MTTNAKKDKTAEGAEPEAKTAATIADGNAANAENVAAAVVEKAKEEDKQIKDRAQAEKELADLEARHAKMRAEMAKLEEKQAAIAQQLDKPGKQPARIRIKSTALNAEKALDHLHDNWPKDGTSPPQTIAAKTYRVTPTGSASAELPIAEVSNCSDEGDAKAAYAMATRRQVEVKVEEIGRDEYSRPYNDSTADPASADA